MSKERTKKNSAKNEATKTKSKDSVNWLKFLEPKICEELLVHPKKIEEIKGWFELTKKSNRILLLIGPTGCSKLTTIKVLGKEVYDYDVCEWTVKQEVDRNLLMDEDGYNANNRGTAFEDFLLKASRFNSIFSQRDRLLVVKDFPNTFLRKGNEDVFFNLLKKFKFKTTSSLVFILTESNSKSLNIEYNLFPENVRMQLGIDSINMNAISITNMKKALKQICAKMKEHESQFTEPTLNVIDDICAQSQGDIRNAVMNLQIVCQKGSASLEMLTKSKVNKKSGKTSKAPKDKISKGVGRDEVLGIFHGVGRSLFPKWEENKETKKMKLTHCPEVLADFFSSQPGNYIELVHSNYLKNFSSIDDVSRFTESMSRSEVLQSEYRSAGKLQLLSLNLVIRAAMVCNTQPPKGFRPINCYASKKFRNVEEKCLQEYFLHSCKFNDGHRISVKDFFMDYTSLTKHIQK